MSPLDALQAQYGNVWETFDDMAIGVAASRRRPITQAMYEAGHRQVLLADDLEELAAKLRRQQSLDITVPSPAGQPTALLRRASQGPS